MEAFSSSSLEESPRVLQDPQYVKSCGIRHSCSRAVLLNSIKLQGKRKDLSEAIKLHTNIQEQGLIRNDINVGTAIISMYAQCGALALAEKVFEELPAHDVVSWTALIAGYVQNELGNEALNCFRDMRNEGVSPNAHTFACVLKACGMSESFQAGEEIHSEVVNQGILGSDVVLGSALVDMYMKCGALANAEKVFQGLPRRNVVTWTAMITGYAQHGFADKALDCFTGMRDEGLNPNVITYVCILKACGSARSIHIGDEIHIEIVKQDRLRKNVMIGNALLDMYVKCGALAKVQAVFDAHTARDVVTWTTSIVGYAQHDLGDEALKCFSSMQEEGILPDFVTFSSILKACGNLGSVKKGEEIHAKICNKLLKSDTTLGTALIDMYVKYGALSKAQDLFDKLTSPDTISWNALIAGFAQTGQMKASFDIFDKMVEKGNKPDDVTFIILLSACTHAGLVDEGQSCFDAMTSEYFLTPTVEHYTCMVDLFSRAGHFHKAIVLVEEVLPSNRFQLWLALLAACTQWINLELGRWIFEHLEELGVDNPGAYVCMSNIYAGMPMEDEAQQSVEMKIP